ncbi:unnamed protein product [Medioppia subpectinata]|uniref:Uncharacterized protein n=1 Tax=Medioppia subpectinata TaxID=1979941 RepID=A0A7R9LXA5_9ACAR|nr:unnamed protein product [Medioppia subpectinata]CAG2122541.1 unnamed protein product [Medioppia subpectinata]
MKRKSQVFRRHRHKSKGKLMKTKVVCLLKTTAHTEAEPLPQHTIRSQRRCLGLRENC